MLLFGELAVYSPEGESWMAETAEAVAGARHEPHPRSVARRSGEDNNTMTASSDELFHDTLSPVSALRFYVSTDCISPWCRSFILRANAPLNPQLPEPLVHAMPILYAIQCSSLSAQQTGGSNALSTDRYARIPFGYVFW